MAICPTREIPIPLAVTFMFLTSQPKLVSIANYSQMVKVKSENVSSQAIAVADRLHSAAIHLLRRVRKQDAATGEGPARLSALSVLVFAGQKTLGELAAAEQVKPPTVSRIVAGLKSSRLVETTADAHDARRKQIHATSKGVALLRAG